MPNESQDLWLTFNGEIYNHQDLRRELERAGHIDLTTRCDAEVVVHGYEEWDVDVFPRLSGMWAIALVDEQRRELLLAEMRAASSHLSGRQVGGLALAPTLWR